MEQIVIRVKEKGKARILAELLASLDFVSSIQTSEIEDSDVETTSEETTDFFSLAGLWADRDVTVESLRQKAWPRQNQ